MYRRHFLRGLAASLSLPSLEAYAQRKPAISTTAAGHPLRMAYFYIPNGVNLKLWRPIGEGADYTLNESLRPLQPHKQEFQIISGLNQNKASANGDGGGDHARAAATFLTGCQANKTAGTNIRNGISVDQIAAQEIGHHTKLPSLELYAGQTRSSGNCDSGYSCAYINNLSWRNERSPVPSEDSPSTVFELLFGSGSAEQDAKRRAYQKSVLDYVLEDTKSLNKHLPASDRHKMDEYLTSVREIERRIEQSSKLEQKSHTPISMQKPDRENYSYLEKIRLMMDLNFLAFQTDSTRISTLTLGRESGTQTFPSIGVNDGHHSLSHHRGKQEKLQKLAKIDTFYAEQFAYFLEKMKSHKEGESTLLDHTMIVYGSCISDGDRHSHTNLPVILAGGRSAGLTPGRHIQQPKDTPMTNLYLTMLDKFNIHPRRIGDSTRSLSNI